MVGVVSQETLALSVRLVCQPVVERVHLAEHAHLVRVRVRARVRVS